MKKLARHLARSRVAPVRRRRRDHHPNPSTEKELIDPSRAPVGPTNDPSDVRAALDSWDPRFQPLPEIAPVPPDPVTPKRQASRRAKPQRAKPTSAPAPPQDLKGPEITTQQNEVPASLKRRRSALSVCVSEEEAKLLRAHAAKLGLGFSEWARGTMFRAMGRKVPARPKRS